MTRVTVGTASPAIEVHDAPGALSYTQLAMLHPAYPYSCPRKWAYKYRLLLPEERTPALALGSAFDVAANAYFAARITGTEPLPASAQAIELGFAHLRDEAANTPGVFGDATDEYEAVLMGGWSAFLEHEGGAQVAAVQSRHQFTMRVDERHHMPVVGYSDRLDADGTLCDHKFSGSARWDKDGNWHGEWVNERRDQLVTYWLARAAEAKRSGEPLTPALNGRVRLVVIHHNRKLVTPQVRVCELEVALDDDALALLGRYGEASRTVHEDKYPARPGRACSFCSFVERCRSDELARGRPFFEMIDVPF